MAHKSQLGCLIIDCHTDDLDREAEFWGQAFGYEVVRRHQPGDENYRGLATQPGQPRVLLQKVEHESRIHLDIETDNIDAEVNRLADLGAREISRTKGWCVMEALSGHRFCVIKQGRTDFDDNAVVWE